MKTTYYKHKVEHLINISKIITVHYFGLGPYFKSRGESHDFWEMVVANKHAVLCTADGKEILLREGEALFHKPNEFHTLSSVEGTEPQIFILSFECRSEAMRFFEHKHLMLNRELKRYISMILEESRLTFDLSKSTPDTKRLRLASNASLGGLQLIKNLTEILLITIMQMESDAEKLFWKGTLKEHITQKIIEYLKAHVEGTVSLDELAHHLSYTKSYLHRVFKATTGETIVAYYTRLKIKRAKKMLRDTEMSVTEIAMALEFDTPNYFSKTYKKIEGITPMQYRKGL